MESVDTPPRFVAFICPDCHHLAVRWADVNNTVCPDCEEKGLR